MQKVLKYYTASDWGRQSNRMRTVTVSCQTQPLEYRHENPFRGADGLSQKELGSPFWACASLDAMEPLPQAPFSWGAADSVSASCNCSLPQQLKSQ